MRWTATFTLIFLVGLPLLPAAENSDKVIQYWLDVAEETAKKQTISLIADESHTFKLHQPAIFRHAQPLRGDDIGSVFVWTNDSGRPAAVGVFFSWSQAPYRWVMEEFHSLHDQPIQKTMPNHVTWTCPQPGIQWKPIPTIPPPAGTPSRMRIQAKQFARQLTVFTEKSPGNRDVLRPVPKPFYEYDDPDAGIQYGALIGYCQGTDTELILQVEARMSNDKLAWFYALATFTDYGLHVELPDQTTWEGPKGRSGENGKPHYWNSVERRRKPSFEK